MECNDKNCPKHGSLAARGVVLEGTVVSAKMQGTVIVQREYYVKVNKYQRFRRSTSRIPAHNPPCINAKEGDIVRIMECRKLGRTVSFVVVEKLTGKEAEEKHAHEDKHKSVKEKEEAEQSVEENKKKEASTKKKTKVKNG